MRICFAKWIPCLVVLACACFVASTRAAEHAPAENLAPNPGFEAPAGEDGAVPDDWDFFSPMKGGSLGITRNEKHSGKQCLVMKAIGTKDVSQGLLKDFIVEPGDKYSFVVYIRNSREEPLGGSAEGMLVIEWLDSSGKEVSRDETRPWNRTLSRMRWDRVAIKKAKAPKDAARARFGIHLVDGEDGGEGQFFTDDVEIMKE